jgi:hypothetical protein
MRQDGLSMIAPRWPRSFLLAALAWLAGCTGAPSVGGLGSGELVSDGPPVQLSIRGRITSEMVEQLAPLLPPHGAPPRVVVYLASGGGDFDAALAVARWLERVPRSTAVVTHECDSACLIIFAAAQERLVDGRAEFGAHGPECLTKGLLGLPCRIFWEPWARTELHDRIARASSPWIAYLDRQAPPAFDRSGADLVRVTGDQLIGFGAATKLTRGTMQATLTGE